MEQEEKGPIAEKSVLIARIRIASRIINRSQRCNFRAIDLGEVKCLLEERHLILTLGLYCYLMNILIFVIYLIKLYLII